MYLYLDDVSKRVAASAKIDKFLGNVMPVYKVREHVEALVIGHDTLGYRVIVDNLHRGIIYENEVYQPLEVGERYEACVKRVRHDGKIDLTLNERVGVRIAPLEERIIELINASADAMLPLTDKSTPELIKQMLQCSKKDFKRAVGALYKSRRIVITPSGYGWPEGSLSPILQKFRIFAHRSAGTSPQNQSDYIPFTLSYTK